VLFPESNKKDLVDIPEDVRKKLQMIPVSHMDEVISLTIERLSENKNIKMNKRNGESEI
jgi:ATP-dependent Lon protease